MTVFKGAREARGRRGSLEERRSFPNRQAQPDGWGIAASIRRRGCASCRPQRDPPQAPPSEGRGIITQEESAGIRRMYPTTCIRLQGPCLVPALKGPTPNPSLRREGNNHPRREHGNPKNVSDDVHPLQGPCLVPALKKRSTACMHGKSQLYIKRGWDISLGPARGTAPAADACYVYMQLAFTRPSLGDYSPPLGGRGLGVGLPFGLAVGFHEPLVG